MPIMMESNVMGDALGATATKRMRRSVEVSKQTILERAEHYLIAEGLNGVKVQKIARDLGLSDAAIHYHFGNRQKRWHLLNAKSGEEIAQTVVEEVEVLIDGHLQRVEPFLADMVWLPDGSRRHHGGVLAAEPPERASLPDTDRAPSQQVADDRPYLPRGQRS